MDVDKEVPVATEIPPAFVEVREDDFENQGVDRKTGSHE